MDDSGGSLEFEREEQLNAILLPLVQALEKGEIINRKKILAEHPDFAVELKEFFAGQDCLEHFVVKNPSAADADLGQLGDFRLLREIGRGGMGVVYEAWQISLGRRVALKLLPFVSALDARRLQRFKNEAQAAALLSHPNIVPIYEVGSEEGVHFYTMQFIAGRTLAAMIHDLSEETSSKEPAATRMTRTARHFLLAAKLGVKAAQALDHAHQMGVIHRDVKPANLLLDESGQLWIADFGVALLNSGGGLTMTGEVVGTLRYMSPEQTIGQRGLVDHRTDIFSLGATLYELLTLEPPFVSRSPRRLRQQIASEDPRPLRSLDPAIPEELEVIIQKALAKFPADRYATAQDLAADLERFLRNKPILARRPTLLERTLVWSQRHIRAILAVVVFLFLTSLGLLTGTVLLILWR